MISGMRHWLAGVILLAAKHGRKRPRQSSWGHWGPSSHLCGRDFQGMSYVLLNYDRAGYERWDARVRSQSLEATVGDVLRLLKESPMMGCYPGCDQALLDLSARAS